MEDRNCYKAIRGWVIDVTIVSVDRDRIWQGASGEAGKRAIAVSICAAHNPVIDMPAAQYTAASLPSENEGMGARITSDLDTKKDCSPPNV